MATTPRRISVLVTPAQLRVLNEALAYHETRAEAGEVETPLAVVARTRRAVWLAMSPARVAPARPRES